MSERGTALTKRFSQLMSLRSRWDGMWRDLKDYVRPHVDDFNASSTAGVSQTIRMYDNTALWSLEQLAAGLNSFLTSPTLRWFNLRIANKDDYTDDELTWLELVSDIIYSEYSRPEVNFNPSIHECYLDLGAFGTCVMNQEYNTSDRHIKFRAFPLSICYMVEDANGNIRELHRRIVMTAKQIADEFDTVPPGIMEKRMKNPDEEMQVIHAVFFREDRDIYSLDVKNMPYASVWVVEKSGEILRESGFRGWPYHVGRWTKLAGEMYGRSPAMSCLADILMVNQMAKTVIKGAQKVVDPPIMLPNEGFMMPIKTSPGSLIFYEPGTDEMKPFETRGQVDIGIDMIGYHRERIRQSFFVDWILREKKRERQTQLEVMDDREEILRQMAPMLGRIQSEMLGPIVDRSFELLARAGRLPQPPQSLDGREIEIVYVSPAAMAQFGGKAMSMQRYMQDVTTLAQVDNTVLDQVDTDAMARELAELRDVPRAVIRPLDAVEARRQQRAEQAAQQQQLDAGVQISQAMKNVADAQAAV